MEPETNQEFIHKGRKIVIVAKGGANAGKSALAEASSGSTSPVDADVTIDGEPIPVHYDLDTKKYIATAQSPYLSHDSLTDLAKHVAEHVINKRSD